VRTAWKIAGLTVKHPLQPLPRGSNRDTRWTPVGDSGGLTYILSAA
jgi:hypothetical protein